MRERPPVCQEQLTIPGATLRCTLPAGHHSDEHYDPARRELWIHPQAVLRRARAGSRPNDAPWTGEARQEPA